MKKGYIKIDNLEIRITTIQNDLDLINSIFTEIHSKDTKETRFKNLINRYRSTLYRDEDYASLLTRLLKLLRRENNKRSKAMKALDLSKLYKEKELGNFIIFERGGVLQIKLNTKNKRTS